MRARGAPPTEAPAPLSWAYEAQDVAPLWTAQEVADSVRETLAEPLVVPSTFFGRFMEARSHGDDACPGPGTSFEVLQGCTTEDGWHFIGMATSTPMDTDTRIFDRIYADMQIVRPDGTRIGMGGSVVASYGDLAPGVIEASGYFSGIVIDTGVDSPFDPRVDGLLDYRAGVRGEFSWVVLDGPIVYPGGVLQFEELSFNPTTCPPSSVEGAVRIRDDVGRWYRLDFGADCDTCGDVTHQDGTPAGEGCVDLVDVGEDVAERMLVPWR